MKIIITNNYKNYIAGKADGIQFLNVEDADIETFKFLTEKYGKEIVVKESISSTISVEENSEVEIVPEIKVKEKKVWIHKGKELKKINESELTSYMDLGFKIGKKDK